MTRRSVLAATLAVAGLVGAAVVVDTPTAVDAAPAIDHGKGTPGFCPTSTGVTVVVDFQQLGGRTIVRCFPSASRGTGLDALKGAGFQIEGVRRWGEAFICRVENRPSAVEGLAVDGDDGYREACIDTPPAAAYWSYWHAGNNCAWEYSQWGVKNRNFVPGGFEGWSFSLNATADTNPEPRIAAVRPGTEGGACHAPDEPAPATDDPDERQPTVDAPGPGAGDGGPPAGDDGSAPGDGNDDGDGDGDGEADGGGTGGEDGPGSAGDDDLPAPRPRPRTTAPEDPNDPDGDDPDGRAAADPADNVAFTGGEDAPDVNDVLAGQSNASPWAPWAAAGVIVTLLGGAGVTARRRRRLRDA